MPERTLVGDLFELDHTRRVALDLGHHVGQKEGRIVGILVHPKERALRRLLWQPVLARIKWAGVAPHVLERDASDARLEQATRNVDDRQHALPRRHATDHAVHDDVVLHVRLARPRQHRLERLEWILAQHHRVAVVVERAHEWMVDAFENAADLDTGELLMVLEENWHATILRDRRRLDQISRRCI